jgi:UDP-N-acetylmuramate dehydrogenase
MDMAEGAGWRGALPAGEWRSHEPMHKHTSWRAGGEAACAYFPRDLDDLAAMCAGLAGVQHVYPVGLGSNLLVRDGGFRGSVVFTHGALKRVELDRGADDSILLYAEAGVASPKAARSACTHGLRGAEFLAGIPGTIGGALAMNAGCYGRETWDIVHSVLTLDASGQRRRRMPHEYDVGYRHVALRGVAAPHCGPQEIFLAAWLRLSPGDGEEGRRLIRSLLQRRIASQPLEQPNAGSVFRNPPGDHAARLIESCGLKGCAIGAAMVSPKHANFIVNTGGARAADIEALIDHVQHIVSERCGVMLVREVRIIGDKV